MKSAALGILINVSWYMWARRSLGKTVWWIVCSSCPYEGGPLSLGGSWTGLGCSSSSQASQTLTCDWDGSHQIVMRNVWFWIWSAIFGTFCDSTHSIEGSKKRNQKKKISKYSFCFRVHNHLGKTIYLRNILRTFQGSNLVEFRTNKAHIGMNKHLDGINHTWSLKELTSKYLFWSK